MFQRTRALWLQQRSATKSVATLLKGKTDAFKGITVDLSQPNHTTHSLAVPLDEQNPLFSKSNEFDASLKRSTREWREMGVRGVWLKIPIEQSHLITTAVSNGFVFHHAEPSYVMMTNWLPNPEHDPNKLPVHTQHFSK